MTQLSLCTIVKNEEINLPRCLESVKGVVDEMVILDTGSTDGTVEIAKGFGASVAYFEWVGDFSMARNAALEYVKGDWVLVLDADEVLNRQIVPQLREAIASQDSLVVNLIRQEVGAAQSPYSLVSRLFRHHQDLRFTRPYHASIDDSVSELLARESQWRVVDFPSLAIFHYGYQPQAIQALDKENRAREAMEGFLAANPNDAYTCSKLGAIYLKIGREKDGIKLLKKGIKSNQASPQVLYELHYHLANALSRNKQTKSALKHYHKALEQPILDHLKLGSYNNLGNLLHGAGHWQQAYQVYTAALAIDPTFATGYYNLGLLLKAKGRLPEAINVYQKAIELVPNYADAYRNLGLALFRAGYLNESGAALRQALALYERQDPQEAEHYRQGLQELGLI